MPRDTCNLCGQTVGKTSVHECPTAKCKGCGENFIELLSHHLVDAKGNFHFHLNISRRPMKAAQSITTIEEVPIPNSEPAMTQSLIRII